MADFVVIQFLSDGICFVQVSARCQASILLYSMAHVYTLGTLSPVGTRILDHLLMMDYNHCNLHFPVN